MAKAKFTRVQCMPSQVETRTIIFSTIQYIAKYGMTQIGEVRADLVCAPRFKFKR